jgi:RNA polymerase sigma factor (sigma-70 family)
VASEGGPGELVRRAAEGDTEAWAELVERFAPLVWSVARAHRLREADAADVSQTIWLRLVEHLDRLTDPDRLAGWLVVTTRHECLRTLRWSQRVDLTAEPVVDVRTDDVGRALEQQERAAALMTAVERLPSRCHLLVRLLLLDPPPAYDVISETLEMPVGSIGPTRARCLQRLREDLGAIGITAPSEGSG